MGESYAEQNFGKPLTKITLKDLNDFFAIEHEESDTLEFKSYYEHGQNNHTHKENGVLKTICAYLNSSGGLLIWGAPVGHTPPGRQHKIFTGALSPVSKLIEKDTFISKVANSIYPLSNLVKMHRVKVEAGMYVYIFDVFQSTYKPHQFDNRYWVRSDGQSNVAPHYLIDALFKQVRYPNLGGYIKFGECKYVRHNIMNMEVKVFVLNHSKDLNEHNVHFSLLTTLGQFTNNPDGCTYSMEDKQAKREDFVKILSYSDTPSHRFLLQIDYALFKDSVIKLMLLFGGQQCPNRRSEYTLSFQGLANYGPTKPEKVANMFKIDRLLNQTMHNYELSEEERVRQILGE
jgi:hypothetical protein